MTQTRRSPPRGPAGDSDDPTLRDVDIDAGGRVAVDERDDEPAPSLADRFTDWRRHYFPLPDEVVDEYLADDEYVIHSDHPSFRAFLIQNVTQVALATVMLPVVFAFVRMDLEWWWILLMVLGLDLVLLVLAIKRLGDRYTSYVITNLRLIRCSGIVSRRLASIPWTRMTGLGYRQKPIGRLMGFATIHIESANEESGLREFSDINDPATFHQLILDMTMSKAGPKPEKPTKGVRRTLRQRRREAREAARKQAETAKVEAVEARADDGKGNGDGDPADGGADDATGTAAPDTSKPGDGKGAKASATTGAGAGAPPVAVKDPTPPRGNPVVRINPPPGTTVTDRSGRRTGPDSPPADDAPSSSPPPPATGRPRSRRPTGRPGAPGPGAGPGPGRGRVPTGDPADPANLVDRPDDADPAAGGPVGPPPDAPPRGPGRPAGNRRPRGADRGATADPPRASGRPGTPADDPSVADLGGTPASGPPDAPSTARTPRTDSGPGTVPAADDPASGPVTPPRQRLAGPRRQAADAGVTGLGDGPGSRRTRPPGNRPGSWAWPGGQRPEGNRPGSPGTASPQPASAAPPSEPLLGRLRRDVDRLRASLRRSGTEIDPETGERVTARDALGQVRRGGGRGTPRRRPRFPNFGRSQPKTPSNRQLPATSTPPTPPRGNRPTRIDDE